MQNHLSHQQLQKLGNTLIYLADNVGELSKTKILKLLFLLEESSVKRFGYPFFGLNFQIWKLGPVLKEVYIDLSEDSPELLKEFIEKDPYDNKLYNSKGEFNDDQFSDNDIYLLEKITDFAKHKTAKDLIDYTHEENSLWRKSAIKNGILQELESAAVNSTEYTIDFSLLFENNEQLKERYFESLENLEFIHHLKG
ncbi:MAG: Panacea domain-containing protein [Ginsengibacter sp.]